MRIAIDCRTIAAPKTGDRTYCLNLTRALASVDPENDYTLCTASHAPLADGLAANFRQDFQPFFAEPLETVRGSARLEGPAAKHLRPSGANAGGGGKGLLAAFDRARPGNNGKFAPADLNGRAGAANGRTHPNNGIFALHLAADQLVGL